MPPTPTSQAHLRTELAAQVLERVSTASAPVSALELLELIGTGSTRERHDLLCQVLVDLDRLIVWAGNGFVPRRVSGWE